MSRLAFFVGAAGMLLLTACSSIDGVLSISDSASSPPTGLVVGDEPYAVKAGALILSQGGSAVDAATATYFALAVTYPVAAGLGGGGVCVVHDQASGRSQTFNFLARDSAGGGPFAVPGNVRGFAMMQSEFGRLPWQRDVSQGEGLAATGFPISRALAARLVASQDVIRLDAGLSAEFLNESGQVKPVGAIVSNPELAATMASIREMRGPLGFYVGPVANKISSYAAGAGGGLTSAELAGYSASLEPARAVPLGDVVAYIPQGNVASGRFATALLVRVGGAQGLSSDANPAASIAAATKQVLDAFKIASLPKDLGATGFAATDTSGEAVACGVTMNGPFGSGRTAKGTGVTLAKSPSSGAAGLSAAFLTPIVATDSSGAIALAGAGAGGPNGTAAAIYALARLSRGADVTRANDIHSTGLAPYDTVNVIACQNGSCAALPDPGGNGLGAAATPPDSQ
ncbi:MAG TPA: gamma-glutamyltransferase [Rhizomicrobium sp.]|jgi:gamma-glutamyltranspeptidase/glutathione hydrolase